MSDVRFEDASIGDVILSFDGRIVERFRYVTAETERLHVGMLVVEVTEPNRKGVREVWCTAGPNRRGGGFRVCVHDADWPVIEPVVSEIRAALAARG